MTDINSPAPWFAILIGLAATAIWTLVFARSLRARWSHLEHRATWVTMAFGAWLASIGTLASAIGFADQRGVLDSGLPPDVWSFIASVGRAALATAGAIVLAHYRPGKR